MVEAGEAKKMKKIGKKFIYFAKIGGNMQYASLV